MSDEMAGLKTLTIKELAAASGIQQWRIRELVTSGIGPPFFRLGMTYRFRIADVTAWLDQQTKSK